MPQIHRPISFDAGIEQILIQDDPTPASLPEGSRALPGDGQILRRLDEVLNPPSVEQALVESLRPEISQRDILSPTGYEAARENAQTALRQAADQMADPAGREALERAVQLLADDRSLHDLLNTYRNILHRA